VNSQLTLDASAVVWSVPESARVSELATRPLLVLLHGRGSHEQDLFSLASLLPPEFVLAALRAPLQVAPGSYSWFPVGDPGMPSIAAADSAVAALLVWLDTVPISTSVTLLGFSQGGAMAVHAIRLAPKRFSSVVNLAGFVIPGEAPADHALLGIMPPVFWGRDPADPVIPTEAVARTAGWLPSHSTLTVRYYEDIGHSISRDELADVNEFLRDILPSGGTPR
jgi:phospholipase/carboxylesterase